MKNIHKSVQTFFCFTDTPSSVLFLFSPFTLGYFPHCKAWFICSLLFPPEVTFLVKSAMEGGGSLPDNHKKKKSERDWSCQIGSRKKDSWKGSNLSQLSSVKSRNSQGLLQLPFTLIIFLCKFMHEGEREADTSSQQVSSVCVSNQLLFPLCSVLVFLLV